MGKVKYPRNYFDGWIDEEDPEVDYEERERERRAAEEDYYADQAWD